MSVILKPSTSVDMIRTLQSRTLATAARSASFPTRSKVIMTRFALTMVKLTFLRKVMFFQEGHLDVAALNALQIKQDSWAHLVRQGEEAVQVEPWAWSGEYSAPGRSSLWARTHALLAS